MKTREELISEGIFEFLDNEQLKEELYSSAYYVYFLINQLDSVEDEYIIFSIKHNIIVLLGGIIEVLLFQYVYKYFQINENETKIKKFCKRFEYKEKSKLIEKSDDETIGFVYCERKIKYEEFKDNINFNYLIKGAKDNHLLDNDILRTIDNFRKIRNGVYLNVLLEIREVFSNSELAEFFRDNKKIIKKIKDNYIRL